MNVSWMKPVIKKEWRLWLVALSFFTRLPVRIADFKEADLNHSAKYFPLVGILVGFIAAAIYGLAIVVWSLEIAVLASMAATIWLTGAFHEDGLADAADGLGGGWGKRASAHHYAGFAPWQFRRNRLVSGVAGQV